MHNIHKLVIAPAQSLINHCALKNRPLPLLYYFCDSPFGKVVAVFDTNPDLIFTGLGFCGDAHATPEAVLKNLWQKNFNHAELKPCDEGHVRAAERLLERAFSGGALTLKVFGTPFQCAVWQELLNIPSGKTESYKGVAQRLIETGTALNTKKPASGGRAIGRAVGANALSYLIPCHRVLNANGKLSNYRWGLRVKKEMLNAEEARVLDGGMLTV